MQLWSPKAFNLRLPNTNSYLSLRVRDSATNDFAATYSNRQNCYAIMCYATFSQNKSNLSPRFFSFIIIVITQNVQELLLTCYENNIASTNFRNSALRWYEPNFVFSLLNYMF